MFSTIFYSHPSRNALYNLTEFTQMTESFLTDQDFKKLFLAPEQIIGEHHTEKIDIWKIPDIVIYMLVLNPDSRSQDVMNSYNNRILIMKILKSMKDMFKRCKEIDSRERPTAGELVERFDGVLEKIENGSFEFDHDQRHDDFNLADFISYYFIDFLWV